MTSLEQLFDNNNQSMNERFRKNDENDQRELELQNTPLMRAWSKNQAGQSARDEIENEVDRKTYDGLMREVDEWTS